MNYCLIPGSPIGLGCRIDQLHICRWGKTTNECPDYDIKQSNGVVQVLELWGMWSTPSYTLLTDSL